MKMNKIVFFILTLSGLVSFFNNSLFASGKMDSDSTGFLLQDSMKLTPGMASGYIRRLLKSGNLWRPGSDTLKISLERLVDQYDDPYDSVVSRLKTFPNNPVTYRPTLITQSDTLPLRWLTRSIFYVDTIRLDKEPALVKKTVILKSMQVDSASLQLLSSVQGWKSIMDSVFSITDTITEVIIDYKYLESKKVTVHQIRNGSVTPPLVPARSRKNTAFTADSSKVIISETRLVTMANPESPFFIVPNEYLNDSLRIALETIMDYNFERDSLLLILNDLNGDETPFWLSARKRDLYRYWVKNARNDSVTVWIGNPARNSMTMILEDGVIVDRPKLKPADDIPVGVFVPDRSLASIKPLPEIPVYWDYGLVSSFSLNQNYLTYWAQGGESSLAGMFDVRLLVKYTNKETNTEWVNRARIRFGAVRTKENGSRINTDILEINSKYNKNLAKKLDLSSMLYFKTQIANGFNYPNDSVVISRFLNPGTYTIGFGLEYKPHKETLLNFAPLSYKNTFVLDTANINQTAHGIEKGKRSRREIGGQLVVLNVLDLKNDLKLTNALRIFSSYLDNPLNMDVDWEATIEKQISFLFSIKLNFHLIYDEDVKFPVSAPDGGIKKAPRTQFNQFLGISLSLNL